MKIQFLSIALVLTASTSFAQQPAAKPAPKAAAPAPAPVVPLPAGAKIAFVNIQAIVASSAEGKADNAKVEALV